MSSEETENQENPSVEQPQDAESDATASDQDTVKAGKLLGKKSVLMEREAELGSDTELVVLKHELKAAKEEAVENFDKYLRAAAEFENFKKRSMKERADLLKYQGERAFVDLLEIVDDFERALQHAGADAGQLKEGLELILKRFVGVLTKWEVKGESAIGKSFDPNFHNALSRVPAPGQAPGTIIGELKKPYFYKDKLIRHGDVIVAAEAAEPAAQSGSEPLENTSEGD
jgi:molecular chaperone GrpE